MCTDTVHAFWMSLPLLMGLWLFSLGKSLTDFFLMESDSASLSVSILMDCFPPGSLFQTACVFKGGEFLLYSIFLYTTVLKTQQILCVIDKFISDRHMKFKYHK